MYNFDIFRFLHPGVLDKGNYSMFAAPRPILPGEPEDSKPVPKEKQVMSQDFAAIEKCRIRRVQLPCKVFSKSCKICLIFNNHLLNTCAQVMIAPPVPAHESAWERGLRQAKEMRRRSSKRRETDVEYEEKKASLSLTQVGKHKQKFKFNQRP